MKVFETVKPRNAPRGKNACYPSFSDEDADLRGVKWSKTKQGYANSSNGFIGTKKVVLLAHRVVMERVCGRTISSTEVCDHINGDKLDNRRENLRLTDARGNAQNRRGSQGRSGVRGVHWHGQAKKWVAGVKNKGKIIYLGLFSSIAEAEKIVSAKRRELGFLDGAAH